VIHDLLDRNLRAGISVPDLAAAAGLSLHHFIKMCREAEGCTPHALLVQKTPEAQEGRSKLNGMGIRIYAAKPSAYPPTTP
jgi:hypothetical protein